MKLSELKTGMTLELRNQKLCKVLLDRANGNRYSGEAWGCLANYRDDLTAPHGRTEDIVAVYAMRTNHEALMFDRGILLWKRQSDTVEVTCEGKTVELSRDSAKVLNLI